MSATCTSSIMYVHPFLNKKMKFINNLYDGQKIVQTMIDDNQVKMIFFLNSLQTIG